MYAAFSYGSVTYGGTAVAFTAADDFSNKKRPKVLLRYGRMNEPIRVPIYDLLLDQETTYMIADAVAGATSIQVQNINRFAVDQFIMIGTEGIENSEIIRVSAVTAPAGNTITLQNPLRFGHGSNAKVTMIEFNRVEYSWANPYNGVKTVMQTLDIQADNLETNYNDLIHTSGYYFARWYNSVTGLFSPYSDGVQIFSYNEYQARAVIQNALGDVNKEISEVITDEYAFMQINNCQEEVKHQLKVWSWLQLFGQNVGKAYVYQHRFAVPPNLDDQFTNGKIYNLSVGKKPDLTWIDKSKMDEFMAGVAYSRIAIGFPLAVGDISIKLEDSGNFKDAGTIQVYGQKLAYTANDRNTGILSLTDASTVSITDGIDVLESSSEGTPLYWTIYDGFAYIYPIVGPYLIGRTFSMDYYKTLSLVRTDKDQIEVPDPTIVQYYLEWKFMVRAQNGEETDGSLSKKGLWIGRLQKLQDKDTLGRTFRLKPRFNNFAKQMSWYGDSRRDRTGNFPYAEDSQ